MAHHIPRATNRVFASLVLTASISATEFVVAQFPIDLKGHIDAFYSENKHKASDINLSDPKMRADVTIGAYCSVEHCQKRVNPITKEPEIQWIMAKASNPRGKIPLSLQLFTALGTITNDVRCFIKWTERKRVDTSKTPDTEEW